MLKNIFAASALVFAASLATPTLAAGPEGGLNPSLNNFVGSATAQQARQATRFQTAPRASQAARYSAGSDNPSLESYSGGGAVDGDARFGTAPQTAENPDFSWVGDVEGGA